MALVSDFRTSAHKDEPCIRRAGHAAFSSFRSIFWLGVTVMLLLSGCAVFKSPHSEWHQAPLDPQTGEVVPLEVILDSEFKNSTPEQVRFRPEARYGVAAIWENGERGFYVFDPLAKTYFGTRDFEAFMNHLESLPQDAVIQHIESCQVWWNTDMPQAEKLRLKAALYRGRGEDELAFPLVICRCGAKQVILPALDNEAKPWSHPE